MASAALGASAASRGAARTGRAPCTPKLSAPSSTFCPTPSRICCSATSSAAQRGAQSGASTPPPHAHTRPHTNAWQPTPRSAPSAAAAWTSMGSNFDPQPTDYRTIGLGRSGNYLSSVVPQGDCSSNGSDQNRTIPVHSGSLASGRRRLIWPSNPLGIHQGLQDHDGHQRLWVCGTVVAALDFDTATPGL